MAKRPVWLARTHPAKKLALLVGRWDVEVLFPGKPPLRGAATGTWLEKNALLALRIHVRGGPPKSVSVLGADDANDSLCMLYTDERGVTRRYEMTLTPRSWTLTRKAPGFSQRFLGRFDVRRRTIHGVWQTSADGRRWLHDFHMTYTKKKGR
jgi:hypothetical protein